MPPVEQDPIEKKSYGKVFFVIGLLALAISHWVFLDEFILRRTWKLYKNEFNHLEVKKLHEEYEKAKALFDAEQAQKDLMTGTVADDQLSIRKIRLRIEEAELKLESREYHEALEKIEELKIVASDAKQEFGFRKADQDEVFYEWKHALAGNHIEHAESLKARYYDLERKIAELKKSKEKADQDVADVQAFLDQTNNEIKKWKTLEKRTLEPLTKIHKKIEGAKDRGDEIVQVVINDLGKGGNVEWGTVDRCESCHVAINRDGFEDQKNPYKTHPRRQEIFSKHPVEQFGCTTCHAGQGRGTQIKDKPFEKGDFAHGYVKHWKEPVVRGDMMQANCNKCHLDQWKLDGAPVYMKGKEIFWTQGCIGCHAIKGFENAPKVGPSLLKVADKVSEEWLVEWIKNPKGYLPHTKMPKPPLDIEEPKQVEKVAAYILQSSQKFNLPFGAYPGGNAQSGKTAFETVGCYGCHTIEGKGTGLAPALDRIAQKTTADWIYNWIQDPKAYNPETKMPRLRLTTQEAADITAYLMSQSTDKENGKPLPKNDLLHAELSSEDAAKKGFVIISQYGCYGCHNIKGFENSSKLSVELTAFAKKDVSELDFGDSRIPKTWADWTQGKIKDPRMYLTERTTSKMPYFNLTDEEIHSLVVFLQGQKKESVPERYLMSKSKARQPNIEQGRRLVEQMNCRGCHVIEGTGGLIQEVMGADVPVPPILDGIGARVRPDWMFAFLKNPEKHKIRPQLNVRMPSFDFTDAEAHAIVEYFSALNKAPSSFTTNNYPKPTQASLAAGAQLASADYFNCFSCHIQNGKTPPSDPIQWGPDLYNAKNRIRYEFIPEWIKDPQLITPGVKMPGFLPSDDAAPQDVLEGNRQKQAEAVRDYIMSLGTSSAPQEAPPQ